MKKYLYGAAVQGIQQFIFRTNDLKSIIQASDQVKDICTDLFDALLQRRGLSLGDKEHAVINAAGNVKYIFDKKEDCEFVVRKFPRLVLNYAPGITISQAVQEYDGDEGFGANVNLLEDKLHSQRNKQARPLTLGLMGINRRRETNLPEEVCTGETSNGETNSSLCRDAFGLDPEGKPYRTVFDTGRMNQDNDWIAVIHADGNGLGQVVQKVGQNRKAFLNFSQQLDLDTKTAAQKAFRRIQEDCSTEKWKRVPIRPIVLGGDDFSVICRADIAIPYITYFIEEFEKASKGNVKGGLTACAGIAFVKSSFPFYYAYELAESLCKEAKKEAKENCGNNPAPSCLMFHKVQDSFITNYDDIEARELTPNADVSFRFGPYYLHERPNRWTIGHLLDQASLLSAKGKDGNAVKSRLRNWMTLLQDNPGMAAQDLLRIKAICQDKELLQLIDQVTDVANKRIPVYDLLAVHTLNVQVTKTTPQR